MAGLSGSETGRGARGWSFLAGTVALVTAVTLWLTAVPTAAAPVAVRSVDCGFSPVFFSHIYLHIIRDGSVTLTGHKLKKRMAK